MRDVRPGEGKGAARRGVERREKERVACEISFKLGCCAAAIFSMEAAAPPRSTPALALSLTRALPT